MNDFKKMWENEARFGYLAIKPKIKMLNKKFARILEIGCGSGILISNLKNIFHNFQFDGIEPYSNAFTNLKKIKKDINIIERSYENFKPSNKYTLIYSVNVFEHLNNWRHFLQWAHKALEDKGKIIILCPNYAFHYESHFKIPIIYNKKVTFALFKNKIKDFEKQNKCYGLWDSLNFVKKQEVINEIKKNNNFKINDNLEIIDIIFDRFKNDLEFRSRQMKFYKLSIFLRTIRFQIFCKIFNKYFPYMMLELEKK